MEYRFSTVLPASQRVDIYLSALFGDISRSYIQKLIDTGCVKVNGSEIKKNLKVHHKDEIHIREIISSSDILPEEIPLDIIYENNDFYIINKDAGINVHPTPGIQGKSGTLVNALLHYSSENLPIINGEERPGIVHRLDKDTSGLIIVAKNDISMRELADLFKSRNIAKTYTAIVAGIFPENEFEITSHIGRHPTSRVKMTTQNPLSPKYARTTGKLLGTIDGLYSVLELELHTGRTHQIRVHLAEIGYPIIGDSVYGDIKINQEVQKKYGLTRQALHAQNLSFELFGTSYDFHAPYKDDMSVLIQKMDSR